MKKLILLGATVYVAHRLITRVRISPHPDGGHTVSVEPTNKPPRFPMLGAWLEGKLFQVSPYSYVCGEPGCKARFYNTSKPMMDTSIADHNREAHGKE